MEFESLKELSENKLKKWRKNRLLLNIGARDQIRDQLRNDDNDGKTLKSENLAKILKEYADQYGDEDEFDDAAYNFDKDSELNKAIDEHIKTGDKNCANLDFTKLVEMLANGREKDRNISHDEKRSSRSSRRSSTREQSSRSPSEESEEKTPTPEKKKKKSKGRGRPSHVDHSLPPRKSGHSKKSRPKSQERHKKSSKSYSSKKRSPSSPPAFSPFPGMDPKMFEKMQQNPMQAMFFNPFMANSMMQQMYSTPTQSKPSKNYRKSSSKHKKSHRRQRSSSEDSDSSTDTEDEVSSKFFENVTDAETLYEKLKMSSEARVLEVHPWMINWKQLSKIKSTAIPKDLTQINDHQLIRLLCYWNPKTKLQKEQRDMHMYAIWRTQSFSSVQPKHVTSLMDKVNKIDGLYNKGIRCTKADIDRFAVDSIVDEMNQKYEELEAKFSNASFSSKRPFGETGSGRRQAKRSQKSGATYLKSCNNFNNRHKGCNLDEGTCQYEHICAICANRNVASKFPKFECKNHEKQNADA